MNCFVKELNTYMYISRHNIGNLYEARLIREMDERVIDYLNDNKEDLPFSDIFEDKLRIYIPIYSDPTAKEILDTLKRIKDYGGLDLEKGEVIRKVKLDPKYGQGSEKEQRMNIGSAISKLKLTDEDKKKYLDWLAKYKDNIRTSLGESKYGIIISRAPIDVLRMSDHARITSCHSVTGGYFQCAVQEAINGGAIAYVVENEDLQEALQSWDLQDDELFYDEDRHGSEMELAPLSRLRIRRLNSLDKTTEVAIPDTKIYGNNNIPGFYETVKKFLHEKQSMDFETFSNMDWEKRGGTYYDNTIGALVQSYYDKDYYDLYPKYIEHRREDKNREHGRNEEIKSLTQDLDSECNDIVENYDYGYCEIGYNIEWDDAPYIMPYGSCRISTDNWGFPELGEINFAIEERSDIRNAINGAYDDDEIIWSGFLNWLENQSEMELYSFEFYNGEIKFSFNVEEIYFDSGEFESFAGNINRWDRNLRNMLYTPNEFISVFNEVGILKSPLLDIPEIENYIHNDKDPFGEEGILAMEGDLSGLTVAVIPWAFYIDIEGANIPIRDPFNTRFNKDTEYEFQIALTKMMDTVYKPTPVSKYTQGSLNIESVSHPIEFKVGGLFVGFESGGKITNQKFWLTPTEWTQESMNYFLLMNELSDHVGNLLEVVVIKSLRDKYHQYNEYFGEESQKEKFYSRFVEITPL